MKRHTNLMLAALAAFFAWTTAANAAVVTLVQDTWRDGERATPAAAVYSENGVDSDADLDLESAWYNGGTGSLITTTPGNMQLDPADSSASWTTYFTPEASPVTLAAAGEFVRVTWRFRTGDVNATNTSQNFRGALFDTPAASDRLVADGSPAAAAFQGYALFGNMGETTGNTNSFQLRERTAGNSDLLGTSGNWGALANGLGNSAVGYADTTEYTLTWTLTRNATSGLDISMVMAGGNIGGTGSVAVNFTDATPNTFTYDTFSLRPSNQATTATLFDTSLFMVEVNKIPEPASAALLGLAGLAMIAARRRR